MPGARLSPAGAARRGRTASAAADAHDALLFLELGVEGAFAALADDADRDLALLVTEFPREIPGIADRVIAHPGDDVAGLEAGLLGGRVLHDLDDQHALAVGH